MTKKEYTPFCWKKCFYQVARLEENALGVVGELGNITGSHTIVIVISDLEWEKQAYAMCLCSYESHS